MAGSTGSQRVPYIVLRYMRGPIFVLLAVYATSMVGWFLIPGIDGEPMSLFHAFYFLTYTATTTGFGEIPAEFSDAQRMWSIVSLYAGVIAWLYAVGAIIGLIQNRHFQSALAERRFAGSVARLAEPFVIICGFGNRGSLLTRGLSDAGLSAVILDADADRISAARLRDYQVATAALCADARIPDHLVKAGLTRPTCKAVVALTNDEELNAKISVSARLLNPKVRVVTQLTHPIYGETFAALRPEIHVVDPFRTFARYLGATIHNPAVHMLNEWLIGAPGANLAMYASVPRGTWILCGFGRMGRAISQELETLTIQTVVIDPGFGPGERPQGGRISERANRRALREAGIERAAGVVAGTDSDADNLIIAINARDLNPNVFVLVRQNRHRNEVLFNAAQADLIVQPTLVSARRILFQLTAPLLRTFFEEIRRCQVQENNPFVMEVIRQLHDIVGGRVRPALWTIDVGQGTDALSAMLGAGHRVTFGDLLRDPGDRDRRLGCVPLVIRCADKTTVMPQLSYPLHLGDEVLLCGRKNSQRLLDATLNNEATLRYLASGVDEPRGLVMRRLRRRPAADQPPIGG